MGTPLSAAYGGLARPSGAEPQPVASVIADPITPEAASAHVGETIRGVVADI